MLARLNVLITKFTKEFRDILKVIRRHILKISSFDAAHSSLIWHEMEIEAVGSKCTFMEATLYVLQIRKTTKAI